MFAVPEIVAQNRCSIDADLRELWRHELRQVQRVMSYAGAHDVIVDVLEFVEDASYFGVLLERTGHPLSAKKRRVNRHHWLQNLTSVRARMLFGRISAAWPSR